MLMVYWAAEMVLRLLHRPVVVLECVGRHCYVCGYDLTGNVSGVCPECGTHVPKDDNEPEPTTDLLDK